MNEVRKIGVCDSGLGGLTVLKELLSAEPGCSYIYFGDTAHVPYGNREADEVVGLVTEIARHLERSGCDALILACNTSSALAQSALRATVSVPVVGVIEAASQRAVEVTRTGKISVLANPLTASSGVYGRRIGLEAKLQGRTELQPEVQEIGCPDLVPIVEYGSMETPEARQRLLHYADQIRRFGSDTVVLGCTHYPLLMPVLQPLLGERVQVVNPATLMPALARRIWLLTNQAESGEVAFQVSGDPLSFNGQAARFLGCAVASVRQKLFPTPISPTSAPTSVG